MGLFRNTIRSCTHVHRMKMKDWEAGGLFSAAVISELSNGFRLLHALVRMKS